MRIFFVPLGPYNRLAFFEAPGGGPRGGGCGAQGAETQGTAPRDPVQAPLTTSVDPYGINGMGPPPSDVNVNVGL